MIHPQKNLQEDAYEIESQELFSIKKFQANKNKNFTSESQG